MGSTSSDLFVNVVSGPLPLSAEGAFNFMCVFFFSLQNLKIQPKPHIQTDSCQVCPLCHPTHLTKSGTLLPCPFLTPGSHSLPLCTSLDLQQVLLFFLSFRTSSTLQGPAQFQHHLLRNPLLLDFEFNLLWFWAWGGLMENNTSLRVLSFICILREALFKQQKPTS